MTDPFLGEIRAAAFNFAPKGWALCNGQLLPINQNQALFSLLGTTYGGNGQTTFALPDLQARVPLHLSGGFVQGQKGGEATHTLSIAELPTHTHVVSAAAAPGSQAAPNQHVPAASGSATFGTANDVAMDPQAVAPAGQSQPHENLPPYLVVNFMIALQGIFPSRN